MKRSCSFKQQPSCLSAPGLSRRTLFNIVWFFFLSICFLSVYFTAFLFDIFLLLHVSLCFAISSTGVFLICIFTFSFLTKKKLKKKLFFHNGPIHMRGEVNEASQFKIASISQHSLTLLAKNFGRSIFGHLASHFGQISAKISALMKHR